MIYTCLRAVTESTYSRIPASNTSTKGTTATQAYKIELASGVPLSNIKFFLNQDITMDDFAEFLGKAVTCEFAVMCLMIGSVFAPMVIK